MNNLSVQAYLLGAENKKKADGTFTIYLKVTHYQSRYYIGLKKACLKTQWDAKRGRFNHRYPDYKEANTELKIAEVKAENILHHFYKNDIHFSFNRFKELYEGEGVNVDILTALDMYIEKLQLEQKVTTATSYLTTRNHLKEFGKKKSLPFASITYQFLKKFETYLRVECENKDTSIHIRMREIRATFNRAIKDKTIGVSLYPFNDYSLKELDLSTKKRSIQKAKIKEIESLDLDGFALFTQKLFLFSYYTRGMNFADMAQLKWSDIDTGRIEYKRRKTKRNFSINILPQVEQILDYFKDSNITNNEYVFPIYDCKIHVTEKMRVNRKKSMLTKFNKTLKTVIAPSAGLDGIELTSYVSRHSYAMVLKKGGQSIDVIQEAMGHSSSNTTKIYLEDLDKDILDNVDKNLL